MPTTLTQNPTTTDRIFNFSAGPATLPESVIHQAQNDLWNIDGSGIGVMEHSHRGKVIDRIFKEAEADCRAIAAIDDNYAVLFLQGGASTQFATIPMNYLGKDQTADYADTGVWTTKAIKEAKKFGSVNVCFDGSTCNYDHTPGHDELSISSSAAYFHYCTNNTIYGTRYNTSPRTNAPLIADTSSDMFSRPIDVSRHALIYAGAQKNLGPAGVALVIIRKDFMETGAADLPSMFDYRNHAAKGSMFNTPPVFGVYIMGRVFKWILEQGGLTELEHKNQIKAKLVYDAIDGSGGFYTGVSRPDCRSHMNIAFRCPTPELDAQFVAEALENKMSGLKGHRNAGGCRASIYNAFPHTGCQQLAEFMTEFAKKNG